MRYVIIGNSAAGVRAAETLRKLDPSGKITMIAEENRSAYSRCLLPDYLAGERSADALRIRGLDFYEKKQILTFFGKKAVQVQPQNKEVILADGNKVSYDKLLLATGASSFIPPIPGIQGEHIFGLRNLSDAENILQASASAKRVVVIGGGFVGLEAAYALRSRGLEVTIVEKMPEILPRLFDETAAGILRSNMHAEGIQFILGVGVKEIRSPRWWQSLFGKKSKQVVLEDGQGLEADFVIIAIGTKPNIELAKESGVTINRGIPVNEFMQTNIPDIYAAGDVAETIDIVTGQKGLTPIWPNAVSQGRVAAYNMAGHKLPYGGLIGMQNSVEFREIPAIAMGITTPDHPVHYEILTESKPDGMSYKKLVVKDNILVGMILVGNIQSAGVYGALIKTGTNIARFRQRMFADDFNYADISFS